MTLSDKSDLFSICRFKCTMRRAVSLSESILFTAAMNALYYCDAT